jgi:hypothetical protein
MTAAPPPAEPARPTARAPEPGGLWIRYAPRGWPAPGGWWLDLAKGELVAPAGEGRVGEGGPPAALPELAGGPFDDVVWLPPVPPALRGERDRLAERLLAAGTPVLVQALAGERVGAAGAAVVVDLTQALLAAGGVGGSGGADGEPLDEGGADGRLDEAASSARAAASGEAAAGHERSGAATPSASRGMAGAIFAGELRGAGRCGDEAVSGRSVATRDVDRGPSEPAAGANDAADRGKAEGTAARLAPAADADTTRGAPAVEPPAAHAQTAAGQPAGAGTTAVPFVDPFAGASGAFHRAFAFVPAGAAAVWPLVPGLTDGSDLVAAGLHALAAAGVAAVQPVIPRLAPADRRRLAEGAGDEAFDRLFHGGEPDERAFARAAAARGLAFFLPRPLPRPPLAGAANRRIAADLAVAGELWLRLGRAPSQAQAFFRAARWADETGYDLPALAREGNLGVVAAVDAASRALIEEAAASGREPSLVAQLRAAYVAEEGV